MHRIKKNNLTKFIENVITNEFKNNTAEGICLLARVNVAYKLGDYWAGRLNITFLVKYFITNLTYLNKNKIIKII